MFFFWLLFAFIGCLLGVNKNRKKIGLLLGFFLGPIGWIIMLFVTPLPPDEPERLGVGPIGVFLLTLIVSAATAAILVESLHLRHDEIEGASANRPEEAQIITPAPKLIPLATPARFAPALRATPTAAEIQAEILRKYSAK